MPGTTFIRRLAALAALAAIGALNANAAEQPAPAAAPGPVKNVVLVHGLYADGSSWGKVIPLLQARGLHVTAVQNPTTSLEDDAAAVRRTLALQDGPTVLVGHSWGGMVISEVGNDQKVASLVYVAARAPDAGEDYPALAKRFPTPPARPCSPRRHLRPLPAAAPGDRGVVSPTGADTP